MGGMEGKTLIWFPPWRLVVVGVPPCRLVEVLGLSPGAPLGPREVWYRGFKMAVVVVAAAASPRWRLLQLLTSYPEAGSGDLRRNVIYKNFISAVPVGINLT
jgi:hypothetical protein